MSDGRDPLDEEDICATFARHPDSEGCTEAEFRAVLADHLARGIVRRVPYITTDGNVRFRIERNEARSVALGCL